MRSVNSSTRTPKSLFRLISFMLIVVLCFGLATYFTSRSWRLVTQGETATATCTRFERRRSGRDNESFIWHIRFATADGTQETGQIDASFAGLVVGGTIEVLYDPKSPQRVQANRWVSLWGFPALFAGAGLMFVPLFIRQLVAQRTPAK